MNPRRDRRVSGEQSSWRFFLLAMLAIASACLYAAISWLSWQFDYGSPPQERPIIAVLLLFAAAFVGYAFAVRVALSVPQSRHLLTFIVCSAALFRVTMLFSVPILEVDIYRYLWDGSVSAAGVSPFRFSPDQVRVATAGNTIDKDLLKLVHRRDASPPLAEVLRRVHYGELPTIYPPTSQAVFLAAALTTPANASVPGRVFLMKTWFIAFDMATLLVVVALLKQCRMPVGLCLVYAWCPLLMKEVANSGHLDAVAVFLTTLAVYLAVRLAAAQRARGQRSRENNEPRERQTSSQIRSRIAPALGGGKPAGLWRRAARAVPQKRQLVCDRIPRTISTLRASVLATPVAIVLALAVGAKLYPIALSPLVFLFVARHLGWRHLLIPAAAFAVTTLMVVMPMLPRSSDAARTPPAPAGILSPPEAAAGDPSRGVTAFLRYWEMNDFLFLVVVENLKPSANLPHERTAWFAVVPESIRQRIADYVSHQFGLPEIETPFLVTRFLTAMAFMVLAVCFAIRAARKSDAASFCEAGFLTLAWFWLLCPTQNPWYWMWALPLLPFARGRAWLAVSGLVLVYYLRFWFQYHWPGTSVLGTRYLGTLYFDYVVTWFEFAPWFVWLAAEAILRHRRTGPPDPTCHPEKIDATHPTPRKLVKS